MSKLNESDPKNPLVTAVLVCWNHEPFVQASIMSALDQTYKNIELIVFDNDSSDNSASIIEELANQYNFIFIKQQNIGLIKTLNKALQMAKGEYFTMLSTDDIWLTDKTERQVRYLELNKNVDMLSGDVSCIDDQGQKVNYSHSRTSGPVTFKELMQNNITVCGPTVMARTSVLLSVGGYDESVKIEDLSMALKLAYAGKEILHTGEIYTYYRRHDNNWSSQPLYDETYKIGQLYRDTPEYIDFVNHALSGYFTWLTRHRKMDAMRFLLNEPIKWNYFKIGVRIIKLITPAYMFNFYRHYLKIND